MAGALQSLGLPAAVAGLGLAIAACAGAGPASQSPSARADRGAARVPDRAGAGDGASNVARRDYVGSAACGPCHPTETAEWARSPMHLMTRDARSLPAGEVRAPFDGTRWTFKDDAVVLEQRDGDRFVRIEGAGVPAKTYRVTRVIGGRTREDFAGVETRSGTTGAASTEELVLPVSFVYATGALRYKGYSVMVHERSTLRAGPVWSRTCIFCHNTAPEIDRLIGAVAGPRAHAYQAAQIEPLLPPERRRDVSVTDAAAFERDVADEVTALGGRPAPDGSNPRAVARAAIDVVRSGFDGASLVEEGIGCEACHGGGRDHARDPAVPPSIDPRAPWLAIAETHPSPALAINRMCARCHQVLFSRYPFTWEGGRRDASPGGSHIASGEARDFLLGGCSAAMACTRCHDPHGADARAPEALARLATPAGNATCTPCHEALADPARLRAHAHHDPAGAGGACVACHMPRKQMGLDGTLTRYHRIGSPTDPERVLGDRPIECAICHVDRSVEQLVGSMEAWWPVRYPRQRLQELYGSLDANVVRATLVRGKAHEQAVAVALLGEARARDAAPLVEAQLTNEYPLVREWAQRALDRMGVARGRPADAAQPARRDGAEEDPED